ncbi:MAG: nitrous oxide reductase accessory protein NosL [Armatimonadetes bacterium]|nr:nitrous oxide reductase accessory protein NosL [Armatimonadota bacterium]MDW8121706.1 nitrous oxide reductase accessory protein NosL [Armatimonadota bacterium]
MKPLLIALFLCSASLVGCRPSSGPPVIRWAEESCDRCRMLISDERFAAAAQFPDGSVRQYDDPGCLLDDLREQQQSPEKIWLRSYDGKSWLDAEDAWLVHTDKITTPMGSGLAAFADQEEAQAFAKKFSASLYTFHQFLQKRTGLPQDKSREATKDY